MADSTISAEVAKAQLDGLISYYEIEITEGDKAQRQARQSAYNKVVRAIQAGRLEIKEDHSVVQRIASGAELIYRELDGKAKVAMGTCDEGDHHGKLYAMMGSLSSAGTDAIQQLKGPDNTAVESLGILFLLA